LGDVDVILSYNFAYLYGYANCNIILY